jgi:hypothetical protein
MTMAAMPARPSPEDTAPLRCYELRVRLPHRGQPWHATLLCDGGARRIEFERPLALARYIEQEARLGPCRGLR